MRIADAISDSIVDGPGLRLTIFTQGCPHACPDCHNPETHDPGTGSERPLEELIALLDRRGLIEGLTLSGGEPFMQAGDCARLAEAAQARGLNVWVYTGYRYEQLLAAGRADYDALLAATDVLVDGLYLEEQRDYTLSFRGSRNQRLIDLLKSRTTGQTIHWTAPRDILAHFCVPES